LGCLEKKTDEWRGVRGHTGRCDGEPCATPKKKQISEQKANKEPQKRTKTMVFEQEKVSHNQESDSYMRENENHHRSVNKESIRHFVPFRFLLDCGHRHDFAMWKKSIGVKVVKHIKIQADKAYQGIAKLHENSEIPKKKTKKRPLTKEESANNRRINSERVGIEHTNCRLKRFHILADPYRNRRKRFGLRVSLFCGLHNFELADKIIVS